MKTVFSLLAVLSLTISSVVAAPPSDESIEHLLKAANVQQLLTGMQDQMDATLRAAMAQALKGQNLGADADKFVDSFVKKTVSEMKEELSWEKMKDLYMRVYRETFSQEEVDQLTAFYESATGKAFVAKMPMVMQKSMALMQERIAPMMQRIQKSAQEAMQEMQAKKKP